MLKLIGVAIALGTILVTIAVTNKVRTKEEPFYEPDHNSEEPKGKPSFYPEPDEVHFKTPATTIIKGAKGYEVTRGLNSRTLSKHLIGMGFAFAERNEEVEESVHGIPLFFGHKFIVLYEQGFSFDEVEGTETYGLIRRELDPRDPTSIIDYFLYSLRDSLARLNEPEEERDDYYEYLEQHVLNLMYLLGFDPQVVPHLAEEIVQYEICNHGEIKTCFVKVPRQRSERTLKPPARKSQPE